MQDIHLHTSFAIMAINNRGSNTAKDDAKMILTHGDKDLKDCIWGEMASNRTYQQL